jgi:3-mercaptopyruvate sulfurtransferase SseA
MMCRSLYAWLAALTCSLALAGAAGAEPGRGNLVSVDWLKKNLDSADVVVLDASPGPVYAAKHIPGAVSVDVFSFGVQDPAPADMEARIQSWGISPGKKVVLYDQGGTMLATRIFFDLYYHGYPAADLFILDGGLAKWQEAGGTVTKDVRAPDRGSFRVTRVVEDARVRLPAFLVGSGEPAKHALVEALEPSYHFGESKFFDRAGHIPNGIMLPSGDFYNADKTFKSPEEIRRMLAYLGVRPDQKIYTYCGGGIAASVPFFALRFIVNYPQVSLYKESQLEWLRDDRGLPFWTYDAPRLAREMSWLNGWGNRMLRKYGVSRVSVVDVRSAEAYGQGHVPFAVNVPADELTKHRGDPAKLAELLGAAGVNPDEEAVIVSERGLDGRAALAFVLLESAGQTRVSVMMGSVDDWGFRGFPLVKEPTVVGAKKSPQDLAVPAVAYKASPRSGVLIRDAGATKGHYPKVFLASGPKPPAKSPDGKVIHVPHSELLKADGTPKPAMEIWNILAKAGLPRYAEIICVADDPGDAAINYFLLKLMGFPDVKVLLN